MPLPLTVSCFTEIQISLAFLVPVHLGSPGQRVCVCWCVQVKIWFQNRRSKCKKLLLQHQQRQQLQQQATSDASRAEDATSCAPPCELYAVDHAAVSSQQLPALHRTSPPLPPLPPPPTMRPHSGSRAGLRGDVVAERRDPCNSVTIKLEPGLQRASSSSTSSTPSCCLDDINMGGGALCSYTDPWYCYYYYYYFFNFFYPR